MKNNGFVSIVNPGNNYSYIEDFKLCSEKPDFTTIIGSKNWGHSLNLSLKLANRDIYSGSIVSSRGKEQFYLMDDYKVLFVAFKNTLYGISRDSKKTRDITECWCMGDPDKEHDKIGGFTTNKELGIDSTGHIKYISFNKYENSKYNVFEDEKSIYKYPNAKSHNICIFDKSSISEEEIKKLYNHDSKALDYFEGYYIKKYVFTVHYGLSTDSEMIEQYRYGNEYPDKIYISCPETGINNIYIAIGEGMYKGNNGEFIRIEKIQRQFAENGFDIDDSCIGELQMDFEQGTSIKDIIQIVKMYQKAINQDQQLPR